jgi:hypothetical protein
MTNLERQRLIREQAATGAHRRQEGALPSNRTANEAGLSEQRKTAPTPPEAAADDVAFFADWQTIRIDIEAADRLLALIADGGDPSRLLTGIVGMLEGLRQETARAVTRLAARPAVGPAGAEIAALAERVAYLENQTTAIMRQLSELTDMWRRWAGV